MNNKIIFAENSVTLVCGSETLVFVDLFGGMSFRGSAVVGYENITQKKPGISYAYLEIFEGNEKGVLFDQEPTYNFYSGHYESNGKMIKDLSIEFEEGAQINIPKKRLLVLHAREDNSFVGSVFPNKSGLLPGLFLFKIFTKKVLTFDYKYIKYLLQQGGCAIIRKQKASQAALS